MNFIFLYFQERTSFFQPVVTTRFYYSELLTTSTPHPSRHKCDQLQRLQDRTVGWQRTRLLEPLRDTGPQVTLKKWHHRPNNQLNKAHPNYYLIIQKLHNTQASTKIRLKQSATGVNAKPGNSSTGPSTTDSLSWKTDHNKGRSTCTTTLTQSPTCWNLVEHCIKFYVNV